MLPTIEYDAQQGVERVEPLGQVAVMKKVLFCVAVKNDPPVIVGLPGAARTT